MRLLLDTHALLWWWFDDPRLSRRAREAIAAEDSEVWVSAASAWEVATKVRAGELEHARGLSERFEPGLAAEGFRQLAITVAHALRAGSLPGRHRDPFDRILTAQSLIEELPIVSNDDAVRQFGIETFW
jgi:PIN domain nuclease of toxin-antitoxin system